MGFSPGKPGSTGARDGEAMPGFTRSGWAALSMLAAALAPACLALPAAAQEGGKPVTLIIGEPPGGGYDGYARLLARHIGRHIPGEPTIVPQNMPGAGSVNAMNYMVNLAPKDGRIFAKAHRLSAIHPQLDMQAA